MKVIPLYEANNLACLRLPTNCKWLMSVSRSQPPEKAPDANFSLRPYIDWISLGISLLLGLLCRYVDLHLAW